MYLQDLRDGLAELDREALRRTRRALETPCGPRARVDGEACLAFCSNDYLGLAGDPGLADALAEGARRWGAGSGASHLVSGHYTVHDELEARLARWCGCARSLSFSTGYMANLAAVTALAGRGDTIFADRLNHASLVDGALLSGARFKRYPHRDMASLEAALATSDARHKLIVTDTVFSMDGDLAPLPDLLALAERHDALLVLDDAHGLGVLGPCGAGALAHFGLRSERVVLVGTLGKAAGLAGAFVAGSATVVEWLLQKARSYIYTTAAPPALAHALLCAIDRIHEAEPERAHLFHLIQRLRNGLADSPWTLAESGTPIQPVITGSNASALALSDGLRQRGIWVPAIRPPTVPRGTARLRVTLSAAHTAEDVDRLLAALAELGHAP